MKLTSSYRGNGSRSPIGPGTVDVSVTVDLIERSSENLRILHPNLNEANWASLPPGHPKQRPKGTWGDVLRFGVRLAIALLFDPPRKTRSNLDFTGDGVTATDDPANDRVLITVLPYERESK